MENEKKDKIYSLEELQKKLNNKQKIFCHEYIVDWNASRAARVAGYSEKTHCVIASENLRKPYILQYIDFIKDDIAKEAGISKLMIVNELKKFAFTGFQDINETWMERKDFEDLPNEVRSCIQEIDSKIQKKNIGDDDEVIIVDVEHIKIKLVDKRMALQDLTKMMGWNAPDKTDITTNGDSVNRTIELPEGETMEDLRREMKELLKKD